MSDEFLRRFKARGQNYTKATPPVDPVLVLDFFSGAGGMSCGFHQTRQSSLAFEHVGALDINGEALATLRANLPIPTFQTDVRALAEEPESLARLIPPTHSWTGQAAFGLHRMSSVSGFQRPSEEG